MAGVVFGIVIGVAVLALIIPYPPVGTRRLHDTGKPGWWWWWWFITLVPFGSIILIAFWASEGDDLSPDGKNERAVEKIRELPVPTPESVERTPVPPRTQLRPRRHDGRV